MKPSPLSEQERIDRLRLARTERVGPVAFRHLLERFGAAGPALAGLPQLTSGGGPRLASTESIEREIAAGQALGARLVVLGDADYPQLLAVMDPPPPVLWALGDASLLAKESVAVVGARVASAAGQRFARGLAHELGEAGLIIVSGLARGIDAAAHQGSLPTGTVAVLAGGVDDIYPAEHRALYQEVAARGCLVSESPPGTPAQARDFPRRNRIISGLSRAVVVVEAELRSGSLVTARLAAEQGREVLAVPGSPLDPRARGTNDLIRNGAGLCEGAEDVIRALGRPHNLALREPEKEFGRAPPSTTASVLREDVFRMLSPVPAPCDEIVRTVQGAPGEVFAALVELALEGRAELLGGGLVCRKIA